MTSFYLLIDGPDQGPFSVEYIVNKYASKHFIRIRNFSKEKFIALISGEEKVYEDFYGSTVEKNYISKYCRHFFFNDKVVHLEWVKMYYENNSKNETENFEKILDDAKIWYERFLRLNKSSSDKKLTAFI